jgi:hypothetical protein
MKNLLILLVSSFFGCTGADSDKTTIDQHSNENVKEELLSLERRWLEQEFALDTAYISALLDSSFIAISADRISGKQEELKGIYDNISSMRKDSIFLDSLKLEDAVVNVYDRSAVVTFIVHTYKKEKGRSTEKRTRFYDVWINRSGKWKAVSSQGTAIK